MTSIIFLAFGAVMRRLKAVFREVGERREDAEVGVVGVAGVPVVGEARVRVVGRDRESFGRARRGAMDRGFNGGWARKGVGVGVVLVGAGKGKAMVGGAVVWRESIMDGRSGGMRKVEGGRSA